MTAGRNPLLREDRLDLASVLRHRNPGRPLAAFDVWIEQQTVPVYLSKPLVSRFARDTALSLWAIVEPWLKLGVRTKHYAKRRIVTVFGTLQYSVSSDGQWVEGAARGSGGRLPLGNVLIEAPLSRWGFAQTLLAGDYHAWMSDSYQQFQALESEAKTVCKVRPQFANLWAEQAVDRYLHRLVDVTSLWRRVMTAMALDPEVLRMARRIDGSKRRLGGLNTSMFYTFRGIQQALLEVERLEPVLTPLAWVTRHAWSKAKVPPLQYLRAEFAKRGILPEDWRRLRSARPRPVWEHWHRNKIRGPERLMDFMAEWARVHRGLPISARMPWAMWDTLARTSVEPGEDRLLLPMVWPCRPAVLGEALKRWSATDGPIARQAFVDGDWARVVRWSAHYGEECPVRQKTTWLAVVAAAHEDERRRMAKALANTTRWRVPIATFTSGNYRIVPLTDPLALVDEAIALRHCADTFQSDCASGCVFLFGLRDAQSGHRVATLALNCERGKVEMRDLRRMANRPPTEEDQAVAGVVIERVRSALKENPTPHDDPDTSAPTPQQHVDNLLAAITG